MEDAKGAAVTSTPDNGSKSKEVKLGRDERHELENSK